jgi:hydrogenase maturation protease
MTENQAPEATTQARPLRLKMLSRPDPIVRIVGIGSPFGDDRIGWRVVDALAAMAVEPGVEVALCANPAAELLPLLRGIETLILVDGFCTGAQPGRLVRCSRADLSAGSAALSNHGVSIPALLDLAEALGELPSAIELFGIEIDPASLCRTGAERLSPAVAAAVPRLVTMICQAAAAKLRHRRRLVEHGGGIE